MHDPFAWAAASPSAIAMPISDALAPGQPLAVEALPQRLPLQQLHHGEADPAVLPEVVDGEDVRVRQRGDRLGLALEARRGLGLVGQALGQDLDRHVASEARVPRPVDLAHAAGAEGAE